MCSTSIWSPMSILQKVAKVQIYWPDSCCSKACDVTILVQGLQNFYIPPVTPTPSAITITLPAVQTTIQPSIPVIPSSFVTTIPEIPITWPTSHTHQYLSMEYLIDPAPVISNNSDKDSPMRDCSPSPAAPLIQLEAPIEQLPLPWQAWLRLDCPHPERRSISPSSEESAPKCQHHDDRSYTPITSSLISPLSPSTQPVSEVAASPNVDSPPMQINLLWYASPPSYLDANLNFLFRKTSHSSLGCLCILAMLSVLLIKLWTWPPLLYLCPDSFLTHILQ